MAFPQVPDKAQHDALAAQVADLSTRVAALETKDTTHNHDGVYAAADHAHGTPVPDEPEEPVSFPRWGMLGGPAFDDPVMRSRAVEAGVQIVRNEGVHISWYTDQGTLPDIAGRQVVAAWQRIQADGMEPLGKIYLNNPQPWCGTGIFHKGDPSREGVTPSAVADFAAHCVRELPWVKYWSLGNEYDRDETPQWMDGYAKMMAAGYQAMKNVNPNIVVGVEGGGHHAAVASCLERGVYDNLDVVDHHAHGIAAFEPDNRRYLPKKLEMQAAAGYGHIPVVCTEFGIPAGDGTPDYTQQQIADLLPVRMNGLFDMGVQSIFYFTFCDRPGDTPNIDRFLEVFMVDLDGTRRPVFGEYKAMATA